MFSFMEKLNKEQEPEKVPSLVKPPTGLIPILVKYSSEHINLEVQVGSTEELEEVMDIISKKIYKPSKSKTGSIS